MAAAVLVSAAKPCGGLDVGEARAHGADDAPAADVGADRDGECTGGDDPERAGRCRRPARPAGDQRQGDDAHGLLRVVGAVGEGHEAEEKIWPVAESAALLVDCAVRIWRSVTA